MHLNARLYDALSKTILGLSLLMVFGLTLVLRYVNTAQPLVLNQKADPLFFVALTFFIAAMFGYWSLVGFWWQQYKIKKYGGGLYRLLDEITDDVRPFDFEDQTILVTRTEHWSMPALRVDIVLSSSDEELSMVTWFVLEDQILEHRSMSGLTADLPYADISEVRTLYRRLYAQTRRLELSV